MTSTPAAHGTRLRRRQIAYQVLERLDRLVGVPSLRWLRSLRSAVWIAALACWLLSLRIDALLLFVVAVSLQLMIFQMLVVRTLREDGDQ